jgi:hypothetical protein
LPDRFVAGLLELLGRGLQLRAGGLQRSISQESVEKLQLERKTAKSRRDRTATSASEIYLI